MSIEQELKYKIDESGYSDIKSVLGKPVKKLNQKNIYLIPKDTTDTAKHFVFRVRIQNDIIFICIKKGTTIINGLLRTREEEILLSQSDVPSWEKWSISPSEDIPDIPSEFLEKVSDILTSDIKLRLQGELNNYRLVFKTAWGNIELDKTTFGNNDIEYEIELETEHPETREEIEAFLTENNIGFKMQNLTKFQRFLSRHQGS